MKEFWVYTALRLALFVGAFLIVFGIWALVADEINLLWAIVIAFVLSGIGSFVLLDKQRAAFAARVEQRAGRVSERFEEIKAKEDQ